MLVCDYVLLRRFRLDVDELYDPEGRYAYGGGGVNRAAIVATLSGVVVALVGKLHPSLGFLFSGAWFSGTAVSFATYWILMRRSAAV